MIRFTHVGNCIKCLADLEKLSERNHLPRLPCNFAINTTCQASSNPSLIKLEIMRKEALSFWFWANEFLIKANRRKGGIVMIDAQAMNVIARKRKKSLSAQKPQQAEKTQREFVQVELDDDIEPTLVNRELLLNNISFEEDPDFALPEKKKETKSVSPSKRISVWAAARRLSVVCAGALLAVSAGIYALCASPVAVFGIKAVPMEATGSLAFVREMGEAVLFEIPKAGIAARFLDSSFSVCLSALSILLVGATLFSMHAKRPQPTASA